MLEMLRREGRGTNLYAVYASEDNGHSLSVSVWLGSSQLLQDVDVALGAKGYQANFTLSSLGIDPSTDPRELTCIANLEGQEYKDTTQLLYLPENPYNGSSVKIDRETGYLKVQYEANGAWKTILPFGFYDVRISFSYLEGLWCVANQ